MGAGRWTGFAISLFWVATALAIENKECLECHNPEGGAKPLNVTAWHRSVHRGLKCIQCHTAISELPHDESARVPRAGIPLLCGQCHAQVKNHVKGGSVPFATYQESVHGKYFLSGKNRKAAVCTDCHGSPHAVLSARDPKSKIADVNLPKTCAACHRESVKHYEAGIHGQAWKAGVREVPLCTDCHGEHRMLGPGTVGSPVGKAAVVKTCTMCHASERYLAKFNFPSDRLETFMQSYHGLALQAGSVVAANCESCHGHHDIFPSSDPRSKVHPANLAKTCGQCHPGAGTRVALGSVHLQPTSEKDALLYYIRRLYLFLIVGTIGGMLLFTAADFLKKLGGSSGAPHPHGVVLDRSERLQHMGLVATFAVLAYTGFCHHWPNAWWAWPFQGVVDGVGWRKAIHRWAAAAFGVTAVWHVGWLAFSRRGRFKFLGLLPKSRDAGQAVRLLFYNFGLIKQRPELSRFSFIEKAEYWALMWGSVVMGATGLILIFHNWTLARFPKWFIDVCVLVHFFEAILATLAILVWHGYWVIYNPDVYPMNWAWLTGRVRRSGQASPEIKNRQM